MIPQRSSRSGRNTPTEVAKKSSTAAKSVKSTSATKKSDKVPSKPESPAPKKSSTLPLPKKHNPFGFGMVEESSPVVLKDSTKKSDKISKEEKKTAFVKKRDAKVASKMKASPVSSKKKSPTPVKQANKFQKRDKSKQSVSVVKSSSGLGMFGGKNPFLKKPSKMNKTLIATPSKFEIRGSKSKGKGKTPLGVRPKVASKKS